MTDTFKIIEDAFHIDKVEDTRVCGEIAKASGVNEDSLKKEHDLYFNTVRNQYFVIKKGTESITILSACSKFWNTLSKEGRKKFLICIQIENERNQKEYNTILKKQL